VSNPPSDALVDHRGTVSVILPERNTQLVESSCGLPQDNRNFFEEFGELETRREDRDFGS
jgi:hypothetical protein